MCFAPKTASVTPTAPTPTAATTGDSETTAATTAADRKRLRSAAGYQQNILSGADTSTATDKKSLLG